MSRLDVDDLTGVSETLLRRHHEGFPGYRPHPLPDSQDHRVAVEVLYVLERILSNS